MPEQPIQPASGIDLSNSQVKGKGHAFAFPRQDVPELCLTSAADAPAPDDLSGLDVQHRRAVLSGDNVQ